MSLAPQKQASRRRGSSAEEMRILIEQADADGVTRADMTLRMTLRDVSELKRDPKVAMADISYSPEGMRYLGVLVEQGGVTVSTLDPGGTSFVRGAMAAAAAAPKVKPKPKPRAKSAKKIAAEKAAAEAEAAEAAEEAAEAEVAEV